MPSPNYTSTSLEIQTVPDGNNILTIVCKPFADPTANNIDILAIVGQHINPLLSLCEIRGLSVILNETILYDREQAGIPYASFPMARSMVCPTINSLEDMGIIEIVSRGDREQANVYRLNADYEIVVGTIEQTVSPAISIPVASIAIAIETETVEVDSSAKADPTPLEDLARNLAPSLKDSVVDNNIDIIDLAVSHEGTPEPTCMSEPEPTCEVDSEKAKILERLGVDPTSPMFDILLDDDGATNEMIIDWCEFLEAGHLPFKTCNNPVGVAISRLRRGKSPIWPEVALKPEFVEVSLPKPESDPLADMWGKALDDISIQMTAATFSQFTSSKVLEIDGETLILQVNSEYSRVWIEKDHLPKILRAVQGVDGYQDVRVIEVVARPRRRFVDMT